MTGLSETLASLKDVEGVLGSFVIDSQGDLIAVDLPRFLDPDALRRACPRLQRLIETLDLRDQPVRRGSLRFSTHQLVVQPEAGGNILCVVAPLRCNAAALRMGMNLVTRRLRPLIEQGETSKSPSESAEGPHPSASSSSTGLLRWGVGSAEAIAAQSTAQLPTPEHTGTWVSRVPGSTTRGQRKRLFRGREVDDDPS